MSKRIIISVLIILAIISPAYAIGIAPSSIVIDFKPGLEENFSFIISNSKDYDKPITVGIGAPDLDKSMDLLQYITWGGPYNLTFGPKEVKEFSFMLKLPDTMTPGEHSITIFGAEIPGTSTGAQGGAMMSAYGRIISGLFVRVPYPGIYAEITGFDLPNVVELNKENSLRVKVLNRGKQAISSTVATIRIKDPAGNTVTKLVSEPMDLPVEQEIEFNLKWTPTDIALGNYLAVVEVNYDGNYAYTNKSLTIGDLLIKVTAVPIDLEINPNTIQKVAITGKSYWNQIIDNVYVDITIGDKSFKSESTYFDPLQEKEISLFIDSNGIKSGDYVAKATIHYGNKTDSKEFNATVMAISKMMLYSMIVIVIVIIAVIAVFFFLRKRPRK